MRLLGLFLALICLVVGLALAIADTVPFDTPGGGQSTGIRYARSGDALRALAEDAAE